MKSLIDICDLTREEIAEMITVAEDIIRRPAKYAKKCKGKKITVPDIAVGNPHSKSWWRYETAGAYLAEHNGILTPEEAQECLALVHWKDLVWDNGTVEDTQYSNVYDQQALTLRLRNWNTYETTNTFAL